MKFLLIFLSAILLILAISYPGLFFLAWLALIPTLFVLQDEKSLKRSFLWGWLLGFILYAGVSYWLFYPLRDFSGLPYPLVIVLTLLLLATAGLSRGLWALIYKLFSGERGDSLILLIASWLSIEYLMAQLFPYYPFGNLSLSQADFSPFLQLAELGGSYLVAAAVLLVNGLLFKSLLRQKMGYTLLVALLLLVTMFNANQSLEPIQERSRSAEKTLSLGVVETEISQEDKWLPENIEYNIEIAAELAGEAYEQGAELVIMPETVLTFDYLRNSYYREMFHEYFEQKGYLLVGSQAIKEDPAKQYNSVFMVDTDQEVLGRYNKRILVPGGESVPFPGVLEFFTGERWYSLTPGSENQVLSLSAGDNQGETGNNENGENDENYADDGDLGEGISFQVLICSEILYPPREIDELVDQQFIVNPSNEAWFGRGNLQTQMWQSARLRAVESRMPVIKAGNYATSGKVFSDGSYRLIEGAEVLEVRLLESGRERTIYQKYGDYPAYLALLLILVIGPAYKLYRAAS